jgi:hypothetical protein
LGGGRHKREGAGETRHVLQQVLPASFIGHPHFAQRVFGRLEPLRIEGFFGNGNGREMVVQSPQECSQGAKMRWRFGHERILLVQHFDPVVLNDRVAEDFAGDGVEIFAGLHGDLEVLALADIFDAAMAESVQCGANGLTLRIEDRRFEGNVYAGFH